MIIAFIINQAINFGPSCIFHFHQRDAVSTQFLQIAIICIAVVKVKTGDLSLIRSSAERPGPISNRENAREISSEISALIIFSSQMRNVHSDKHYLAYFIIEMKYLNFTLRLIIQAWVELLIFEL